MDRRELLKIGGLGAIGFPAGAAGNYYRKNGTLNGIFDNPKSVGEIPFETDTDMFQTFTLPEPGLKMVFEVTLETTSPVTVGIYEGNILQAGESQEIASILAKYGEDSSGIIERVATTDLMLRCNPIKDGEISKGIVNISLY